MRNKKNKRIFKGKFKLFMFNIILYIFIGLCGYFVVNIDYLNYIEAEKKIVLYEEYIANNNISFEEFQNYKNYKNILEKNNKNIILVKKWKLMKVYIVFLVILLVFVVFFIIKI